ncbi:DUF2304 domain-containing protein [Luminiphilus sp.]|nr:DUF2304 domain-containing protein [Luminiphilus sp.]
MTQWISAFIGLGISLAILILIRRNRLLVRHGLVWVLVAGVVTAIGIFPQVFDLLAIWTGVAYPPTIALVLGFGALTLKALMSDIELSRVEVKMTRLVQRVAMLEWEINRLQHRDCGDDREPLSTPP